jgi:soluble lytic murein transglycosylase
MQLMPSVAKSIANAKGITPWSADRLYEPGINIVLGVSHLAPLIRKQPDPAYALAAYNAGESRVTRWVKKRGADDPELFTERIPFLETRDYVKVIIRNRELYRALYDWR